MDIIGRRREDAYLLSEVSDIKFDSNYFVVFVIGFRHEKLSQSQWISTLCVKIPY